ncbi:Sigma-70 family RNA polymerase sigma factor [Pseudomonas chlororaphis]
MKSLFSIFPISLVAALYIGFYEKMEDAYPEKVFFIKKSPTFQMKFENIFAYESDDKNLSELSDTERQLVIQYCKYRLGITTTLKSQDELEECRSK